MSGAEWFGWSTRKLAGVAALGIGAAGAAWAVASPRLSLAGVAAAVFAAVAVAHALALWLATG